MKKYVTLAITMLLAASISACGSTKATSSTQAEAQNEEIAAELPEEKTGNDTESMKASSAPENTTAEETALPDNASEEQENAVSPENTTDQQLPEEEKSNEPYGAALTENAGEENIPYIDEDAPAEEIPEEAFDDLGVEMDPEPEEILEDPESPLFEENLPSEGAEVAINEEDFGYAFDEAVETPAEVAGTYTLYAWDQDGKIMKPDAQNSSTMTLDENGTGILIFNEDKIKIEAWGTQGTMFAMSYGEHGAADGTLDNGIIILDPIDGDDVLYFYAKDGVDITTALSTDREKYILED